MMKYESVGFRQLKILAHNKMTFRFFKTLFYTKIFIFLPRANFYL